LGNVWTLTEIWKELGFSDLRRVFGRTRHTIDVEALIRIMVLNRLCDPDSKLGVLRWLQTVAIPDIEVKAVTHQQLLRSMDALMDNQDAVDGVVAGLLRPLVDRDLSLAFYDMTTIRAEGLSTVEGDVRKFGMAKEGLIAKQFMLGVVQTADGLPIYHEVFDGNTAEAKTLLPILKKVMERFPNLLSSTLPARKWLISLETGVQSQTTKRVWRGFRGWAVPTPKLQTATSGRASSRSSRSKSCHPQSVPSADEYA